MDGFNPFAELQQPQLGGALMGAQAQAPAPTPGPAPAGGGDPAIQQRVEGWRSALQELSANPVAGIMLLQMGTAMSSGRKFPDALQMGLGAAGRAGDIQNQYSQQQLKNQMAGRTADLAERKFGLEERELGAREKVWDMQAKNYERMARGGGGRGGGGSSGRGAGTLKAATVKVGNQSVPVFYGVSVDETGKPKVNVYDITGNPITDPQAVKDIMSQVGTGAADDSWAMDWAGKYGTPGEGSYELAEQRTRAALSGQGRGQPQPSQAPGQMSPKDEAIARLRQGGFGSGGGPNQSTGQGPAVKAQLGDITQSATVRGMTPDRVVASLTNGTLDTWISQGWDVRGFLSSIVQDQGYPPAIRATAQSKLQNLR